MDLKVVKAAIETAVAKFCATLPQVPGPFSDTTPRTYTVEEAFGGEPYWFNNFRSDRFEGTLKDGILYRPIIVNEIYDEIMLCLSSRFRKGLMIQGPQGIGKSHSLVNVVHKLQYSGSYLVTFFPDCEKWEGTEDFLDTVCESFGTTLKELGIDSCQFQVDQFNNIFVDAFIEVIDAALAKQGKQWVFVFDQINRLFVRPENRQSKDAGVLAFPFSLIATVMKTNRITSVISASANNELAYKDRHEGFNEYEHPTQMTGEELGLAFSIRDDTMQDLLDVSGGVPLYAHRYTSYPVLFQSNVDADVYRSIEGLRENSEEWGKVSESIYSALLETSTSASRYDKKFLLQEHVQKGGTAMWDYKPLLPAVASSYRRHLWKGLMEYVEKKERDLLDVCKDEATTNDTRGRLFELIVIRRCQAHGVQLQLGAATVKILPGSEHFPGKALPRLSPQSASITYVPYDSNFPAIDWIWVCGNIVIAVQAHVSKHADVKFAFWGMCDAAGWFEEFSQVHLIYLSPEDDTVRLVEQLVCPPKFQPCRHRDDDAPVVSQVHLRALSRSSVSCLEDLQWPDGCSLAPET